MRWKILSFLFVLVGVIASVPTIHAQSGTTTITVALSDFMRNLPVDEALAEFEARHPNIKVQPVYLPFSNFFYPPAAENIDDHLDGAQALAAAADVAMVDADTLAPEATRAGYFLDLAPLAASDAALNPADFLPAAWDAFRWDNGLWALPAKIEPLLFVYDPAAFDQAGLPYPDASWTLDDLANAVHALTQYDASGAVSIPGLVTNGNDAVLLRSLYRQNLSDELGNPRLNTPELAALIEAWAELVDEGVVARFSGENLVDTTLPLTIVGSFGLASDPFAEANGTTKAAALLPGGGIGLTTTGFAVSGGTTHPAEAYELVKFLTENATIQQALIGYRSARVTPPEAPAAPAPGERGMSFAIGALIDPAVTAAIEPLLGQALSGAELRYAGYLADAVSAVNEGTDAVSALSAAEAEAAANLQTASERRGTTPLIVATPIPEVVLAPGEIDLRFGAGFTAQTGEWERLMREFAALDPEVGVVTLDTDFSVAEDYAERNDCFYLNYNAVPALDLALLLALDPFLSADASAPNFAGNALAQVQRDSRTWAYPFVINPALLNYHVDLLARAGVPEPNDGWTISAFVDALRALKAIIPDDQAALTDRGFGDTSLLMLIAAYGGLPIDYRANPPIYNFTDPTTVEAIRQVLDLAKADLINYQELAGNSFMISMGDGENPDPIYSEASGGGIMLIGGGDIRAGNNPYRRATYPSGAYTPAAYEIGAGYISATSQNPAACYRLFKFLEAHPELFDGMPANRDQFTNPTLLATEGDSAVAFYQQFDAIMQDPNTVIIPSTFTGGMRLSGANIMRRWLDRAFDDYVLRDADLLDALTDAQGYVDAFQACMAALPAFDAANPEAYQTGLRTCAVAVDPDMSSMFPPV